jgi:hypothetical protein
VLTVSAAKILVIIQLELRKGIKTNPVIMAGIVEGLTFKCGVSSINLARSATKAGVEVNKSI